MTALDKARPYAKALVAFITPGVVATVAAVQDASPGGSHITGPEWVGIGASMILTAGGVYAVPNAARKRQRKTTGGYDRERLEADRAAVRASLEAASRRSARPKLGRKPNDPSRPRLRFGDVLDASQPVPATADWGTHVDSWPMYLNDQLGDCTCAAAGHHIQAWTSSDGDLVTITDQDVLAGYEAQGYVPGKPSTDQGAVMQDVLDWWRKAGFAGRKVDAFAEVKGEAEARAAVAFFGGCYLGINFPESAMDQFDAGQPWDVVKGSRIEGGHAINAVAYDTAADMWTVVTWGREQQMTGAFFREYVEEAWVILTPDWYGTDDVAPTGVDVQALGQAFTDLTGEPSPFPAPTPQPPAPAPDVDAAFAPAVEHEASLKGTSKAFRTAAAAWLAAQNEGENA